MDELIIFGCGGHAKSVTDVVLYNNPNIKIVFVDKNAHRGELILGFPVTNDIIINKENVFVALGDNNSRRNLCEKYYDNLVSIISNQAYIGKNTHLGSGIFVAHKAHIGVLSTVKDFVVVNTHASIDHECSIGIAASIAPGAILCGKVTIGDNSWIGANATVRENVNISSNVIIGMGAVVTKNIISSGIYIGCPAKRRQIRQTNHL
jgi:sugar O-acyltransferase (sialic acid O-acetyltransferase NeuD family)